MAQCAGIFSLQTYSSVVTQGEFINLVGDDDGRFRLLVPEYAINLKVYV